MRGTEIKTAPAALLAKNSAKGRDRSYSFGPVLAAFAVVAIGFVLASVYGEIHASGIDREAEQIETNALPSLELLADARDALWHVALASDRYVDEVGEGRVEADKAMVAARDLVDRDVASEFATDEYPGEAAAKPEVKRSLAELDRLLARMRELVAQDETQGQKFARRQVREGIERVDSAIDHIMDANALGGQTSARRIATNRRGSLGLILGLNVACVLFAAIAAFVALRSYRRNRSLELAHDELLEVRAADLERFASRVAHDLLSPLSALSFILSSVRRNSEKGLSIAEPLERAGACLRRSQSLVDGVMDFARSGGAPGNGRATLRVIVDGVLDETRAEGVGVDVSVEGVADDIVVACSAGVLTSILGNIVRNAVKYMGDRPDRRLSLRAQTRSGVVRVEVEDTGPGLPAGLEAHVFEPYVRSPDNEKPGLGLGLATVQRFVESHRGRVGVHSLPGAGCTFWFELPSVSPDG